VPDLEYLVWARRLFGRVARVTLPAVTRVDAKPPVPSVRFPSVNRVNVSLTYSITYRIT
jgi:hypothetical protein